MSNGSPWTLVAGREVMVKLRDKNFIISTVLTVLILLGALFVPTLFNGGGTSWEVAVADDQGATIVQQAETTLQDDEAEGSIEAVPVTDRAAAEAAVSDGDTDAALLQAGAGWQLVTDGGPPGELEGLLGQAVTAHAMEQNAAAAGTSVTDLLAGTQLQTVDLTEENGGLPAVMVFLIGMIFAVLFYMSSLVFGIQIANSVVEEKQSRIVEILAAMIPVRQLLLGKVLGNTVLAFGQIALIAAVALIGLTFVDLDVALPGLAQAIGWYVPFFVLGFLALACIWAAAGALASRTEDVQSTSTPLTMVLVVLFIGAINASGTVREVLSFVPVASTFVMPVRIIEGDTAWWEPMAAMVLVLAFSVLTIWLGARLYERALLHTSGTLTWRKALTLKE